MQAGSAGDRHRVLDDRDGVRKHIAQRVGRRFESTDKASRPGSPAESLL